MNMRSKHSRIRRIVCALCGLGAALTLTLGVAQPAAEAHDVSDASITELLQMIDVVPTRAALDAAADDALAVLIEIAQAAEPGYQRDRAISLLSMYVDDPRAWSTLQTLVASDDVAVRRLALYTAGRAFGETPRAHEVATLLAAVAATEAEVAVLEHLCRALAWVDDAQAHATLAELTQHALPSVAELATRSVVTWGQRFPATASETIVPSERVQP